MNCNPILSQSGISPYFKKCLRLHERIKTLIGFLLIQFGTIVPLCCGEIPDKPEDAYVSIGNAWRQAINVADEIRGPLYVAIVNVEKLTVEEKSVTGNDFFEGFANFVSSCVKYEELFKKHPEASIKKTLSFKEQISDKQSGFICWMQTYNDAVDPNSYKTSRIGFDNIDEAKAFAKTMIRSSTAAREAHKKLQEKNKKARENFPP